MKVRNVGTLSIVFILIITLAVGILIGYKFAKNPLPKNCAELGVAYLEIGKKELGITDYGSEQWNKLIEDETRFTNDCYKSYQK